MAAVFKRPSGVDVSNPEIAAVWARMRDDGDRTNWILLHCPSKTEINVLAIGDSGLVGLMAQLDPDKCLYGAVRATVNGYIKFYSFYCAGENVSALQKGKNALYKAGVLICLDGLHGELTFPEGTMTPIGDIIAQISKLTGSPIGKIIV